MSAMIYKCPIKFCDDHSQKMHQLTSFLYVDRSGNMLDNEDKVSGGLINVEALYLSND
jgi:hypothetical protein